MEKGGLVPDDLLNGIIDERLRQPDCADGYILDGFPRTLTQAEGFEHMKRGTPPPRSTSSTSRSRAPSC